MIDELQKRAKELKVRHDKIRDDILTMETKRSILVTQLKDDYKLAPEDLQSNIEQLEKSLDAKKQELVTAMDKFEEKLKELENIVK